MRRLLATMAVALLATGCTGDRGPAGTVQGTVTRGPMCPVVRAGQPCPDQPAPGRLRVVAPDGGVAAEVDVEADGRFLVLVRAGAYVLETEADGAMSCPPVEVSVAAGETTEVTVACDTGIR